MKPYIPSELPISNIDFRRIIKLVGESNAELARYDGLLRGIVNPNILLSPLTTQEAVLSSKIEGTQATLDDILEHDAGLLNDNNKKHDIYEIVNYRKALLLGSESVIDRPITLNLINQMHKILLDSVRGANKTPGEFRKDQNWIGKPGSNIENATFIPPPPYVINDYMENLIKYFELDEFDSLAQLAIIHAQFELIHPFNDGNGRIGRLLIPLFLFRKRILHSPMFYLSSYLETYRDEYYFALNSISKNDDWNLWLEFFLNAIKVQATKNSVIVNKIISLYEFIKIRIAELTHSQYTLQITDAIFNKPIFKSSDLINKLNIPRQTGAVLIKSLKDNNILTTIKEAKGNQPGIYAFWELLKITENEFDK